MDEIENPWGEEPAWVNSSNPNGDEPEEDEDGMYYWYGAQHVVALIDCGSTMFERSCSLSWHDCSTPMNAAIMACERLARNRVLQVATLKTGKRDGVGVMLYGCKTRHEEEDEDEEDGDDHEEVRQSSTQTLVELHPPGVQQIKTLRACLDTSIRGRSLENEFMMNSKRKHGNLSSSVLRDAIQHANLAFSEASFVKSPRVTSMKNPGDAKSIWIFTNQDKCHDDRLGQIMADVAEAGTRFLLWALPKSNGESFDIPSLSYHSMCHQIIQPSSLEDMLEHISFEGKKPRRVMSIPLLLPDLQEPGIQVDFYSIVQEQKKPQPKWIHQTTKQETERVTQTIIKDTGEVIRSNGTSEATGDMNRILHFAAFGTDRVPMTPEDVLKIKQESHQGTDAASLVLMGFKPLHAVPITHTLDKSYFICPNEDFAPGSTDAFSHLHAAMIRRKVVGIGELLTRVTTSSRMVAIFAQEEVVYDDEDGSDDNHDFQEQTIPPGMIVVALPFEDDVRQIEQNLTATADETLVEQAIDLIHHMKLENVEIGVNFENAALERFWSYMEAVALEATIPPKEQYEIELNEENVIQVAGAQIQAFRDSLPVDVKQEKHTKGKAVSTRKRKLLEPDDSGVDWVQLYQTNSIVECKVDELKSYLRSVGARLSGRKDDLALRVSQDIAQRLEAGTL